MIPSNFLVNVVLITTILLLFALVVLPFWLSAPRVSKNKRVIKGVLSPGPRRYTLVLPEDYHDEQQLPLVIALHFAGHGAPYYGDLFLRELIEPALRPLGAIMVAPDCPGKNWIMPESEAFILELMDFLQGEYPIDGMKTLIIGYSMGGIGTWHICARYPDQFKAAVVMAAQPAEGLSLDEWTTPVYIIHGRDDERFPVADTTHVVVQLEESGVEVAYRILEKVSHYETRKFFQPLQEAIPWVKKRWQVQ